MIRSKQQTGAYCGPTVFQMLVSEFGLNLDQEAMVDACGARETVMQDGIPLDSLVKGIKKLFPELGVWTKSDSTLTDLQTLTQKGYVVGVDWQGIFDRDEYCDYQPNKWQNWLDKVKKVPVLKGEQGHYCIALEVDLEKGFLRFADPYGHYAGKDRFVATWEFEERWWDDRLGVDEKGKKVHVYENRLMFLVTKKEDEFPATLGVQKV